MAEKNLWKDECILIAITHTADAVQLCSCSCGLLGLDSWLLSCFFVIFETANKSLRVEPVSRLQAVKLRLVFDLRFVSRLQALLVFKLCLVFVFKLYSSSNLRFASHLQALSR
ncbi:hypothetical protein E2542_SST26953 [Spatholobus suberectus]|nr:hypothetical protein E2542_SST26953 [Spatholobus suberectus]